VRIAVVVLVSFSYNLNVINSRMIVSASTISMHINQCRTSAYRHTKIASTSIVDNRY